MTCQIVSNIPIHGMFADDTHLTYSAANVHDIDQNLNQDLKSVSEWLAANKTYIKYI